MKARVLLVDDQSLARTGLRLLFEASGRLEVVGEAADGEEAVRQAAVLRPDVVLMDLEMPVMNGIEATRRITAAGHGAVLMLTSFSDDESVLACLQAGASGFLLKNAAPERLVEAVAATAAGHGQLAPEVTRLVITRGLDAASTDQVGLSPTNVAALERLTDRERDVLRLVAGGHSNRAIADQLFVGEATVKTHVSSCLTKLGLVSRVQLVVYAFESGFVAAGRQA